MRNLVLELITLCIVGGGAIPNGWGSFSSVKGEEPRLRLRDSFDTKSRKVHANEHGSITVILCYESLVMSVERL